MFKDLSSSIKNYAPKAFLYPANASKNHQKGLNLEAVVKAVLDSYQDLLGLDAHSKCSNLEDWNFEQNSEFPHSADHQFEGRAIESKNWQNSNWKDPKVYPEQVLDKIHSRFLNPENGVTVISQAEYWTQKAFHVNQTRLVTVGIEVNPENSEKAFRILFKKLALAFGLWHLLRPLLVNIIPSTKNKEESQEYDPPEYLLQNFSTYIFEKSNSGLDLLRFLAVRIGEATKLT